MALFATLASALMAAAPTAGTTTAAATTAAGTTAATTTATAAGLTAFEKIALGTSLASAGGGAVQGVQAARTGRKAATAQNIQRKLQSARERRRVVREAQAARASIVAQAEGQGVEGGSTARIGATQGVQSQAGANTSFLDQMAFQGRTGTSALNKAAEQQGRASFLGTTSNVLGSDQFNRVSKTLFS